MLWILYPDNNLSWDLAFSLLPVNVFNVMQTLILTFFTAWTFLLIQILIQNCCDGYIMFFIDIRCPPLQWWNTIWFYLAPLWDLLPTFISFLAYLVVSFTAHYSLIYSNACDPENFPILVLQYIFLLLMITSNFLVCIIWFTILELALLHAYGLGKIKWICSNLPFPCNCICTLLFEKPILDVLCM